MLTELKLSILLEFYILKKHINEKSKDKWYYNSLPKNLVQAFTLAEVLITLLIIGVVSSIVIPALINDTQNAELKTAWKKAYSEIEQANKKIMIDNAGSLKGTFTNGMIVDLYQPYLNHTKKCTASENPYGCWHRANEWYHINGNPRNVDIVGGFILSNGTLIGVWTLSGDCQTQIGTTSFYECGKLMVDVNGFKKPNTVGKDIFAIHVLENRILPTGIQGDWDFITGEGWYLSNNYLLN